jgi:hypothetical protein
MAHSIEKDDKICETDNIMALRYKNRDPNKLFLYKACQKFEVF